MRCSFMSSLTALFREAEAARGVSQATGIPIDWSNYLIGQYTLFSGVEPLPEGNIYFAGEHTSMSFQGFMEGAVQSGESVAKNL